MRRRGCAAYCLQRLKAESRRFDPGLATSEIRRCGSVDTVNSVAGKKRWPGWVYAAGSEPDARFSFANERTFLAWIRTALALLAAGVAVDAFDLSLPDRTQRGLASLLVLLGLLCAVASWVRWARAERAMRRQEPLPASSGVSIIVGLGVVVAAFILLVRM